MNFEKESSRRAWRAYFHDMPFVATQHTTPDNRVTIPPAILKLPIKRSVFFISIAGAFMVVQNSFYLNEGFTGPRPIAAVRSSRRVTDG